MTLTQILIAVFHIVIASLSACHALLYKRESRAALGWVSVCIFFPIFGPIAYFLFGINRVRSKAVYLSDQSAPREFFVSERGPGSRVQPAEESIKRPKETLNLLRRLTDSLEVFPMISGNQVDLLINGEAAYPRMLDAIREARHGVYFMTYIIESNRIGDQFIDALIDAQKRGVDVKVIVDGLGELYSWPRVSRKLKRSGIKTVRFLPPSLFPPSFHINLRNHRKLLIIDGQTAFTGGMNIGGRHMVKDEKNKRPTSDIHFQLSGAIVGQLNTVFHDSWQFTTNESISMYSEAAAKTGLTHCRAVIDGPDENLDKIELIMIGAMSAARKNVQIVTPYFLPSREMISALRTASMLGAKVTIILPEKSNLPYVQWATHNMLGELLSYNVRVLKQPAPFCHAKLLIIDDCYAFVGSANIDPRSLRLNFELGLEVTQGQIIKDLISYFKAAEDKSNDYKLEALDKRLLPIRLRDALCWLFSPYL